MDVCRCGEIGDDDAITIIPCIPMQLSVEEILQLAPDESSAKAAKGLVVPGKWSDLGLNQDVMWGACQGSGSKPYQVQIDLTGPAFRCTCPSRKFPCKHGLALLLLRARDATPFAPQEPPAWVAEWLAARQQKAQQQAQKRTEAAATPVDPQAAAKREAARWQRMQAGLEDLQRWLGDLIRQGLATLPSKPDIWATMASRMVDAQLPGLAFRLRQLQAVAGRGDDWPARLLGHLGQLQILIDAAGRLDQLPAGVEADIQYALGLPTEKEPLLASGERIQDEWLVLGLQIDEEERLRLRRTWLVGRRTGRRALVLDYAHGSARFEHSFVVASTVAMSLVFYPGAAPVRAIVADSPQLLGTSSPIDAPLASVEFARLAGQLAANPWQWPQGLWLGDAVPQRQAQSWQLACSMGTLALRVEAEQGWELLAESGGAPLTVFGEWDGEALRLLNYWPRSNEHTTHSPGALA